MQDATNRQQTNIFRLHERHELATELFKKLQKKKTKKKIACEVVKLAMGLENQRKKRIYNINMFVVYSVEARVEAGAEANKNDGKKWIKYEKRKMFFFFRRTISTIV